MYTVETRERERESELGRVFLREANDREHEYCGVKVIGSSMFWGKEHLCFLAKKRSL